MDVLAAIVRDCWLSLVLALFLILRSGMPGQFPQGHTNQPCREGKAAVPRPIKSPAIPIKMCVFNVIFTNSLPGCHGVWITTDAAQLPGRRRKGLHQLARLSGPRALSACRTGEVTWLMPGTQSDEMPAMRLMRRSLWSSRSTA